MTDIGGNADHYSCPIGRGDPTMYDCRVWLRGRVLRLGQTYDVEASLLDPDAWLDRFSVGDVMALWEGRAIATGEVVAVRAHKTDKSLPK
ncbi:hypothetical protein AXZ95_1287 [Leifsonia sp. 115AMFTsu3.1]|nr:hypothetical protein AXZ95_1287 [Leifsonia sp. 115AMFTsu3.1]